MIHQSDSFTGAVIIGRNEGERLKRCLASAQTQLSTLVYVDSGSSDGSAEYAASIGVSVVNLDMSIPFSAGRARNEGFTRLRSLVDGLRYVQFIDGDCELCPGWIIEAEKYLEAHEEYAIVFGRVKERHPEASVYNMLCDIEWLNFHGEARSCGGIFFARADALLAVGGFDISMVAGEEPEMCYRLRQSGWRLYSLVNEMTLHDADMRRFSQWWKRTVRGGLAYANGYYLHRKDREPHHMRENRRIFMWAFVLPLVILVSAFFYGPLALIMFVVYPAQVLRQFFQRLKITRDWRRSFFYAFFTTLEKFPQFSGQLLFIRRRIFSEKPRIIEYK